MDLIHNILNEYLFCGSIKLFGDGSVASKFAIFFTEKSFSPLFKMKPVRLPIFPIPKLMEIN